LGVSPTRNGEAVAIIGKAKEMIARKERTRLTKAKLNFILSPSLKIISNHRF
jgi:hypothetical protein